MNFRRVVLIALCLIPVRAWLWADSISGGLSAQAPDTVVAAEAGCGCGCGGSCASHLCGCWVAGRSGSLPGDPDARSQAASGTPPAGSAFSVTNFGLSAFTINGSSNPTLTLTRGQTYTFNISAIGHPFWIKTIQSIGTINAFSTGVTNNGIDSGTITFTVPTNAPAQLFYDCQIHAAMTGVINIVSVPEPGSLPLVVAALGLWSLRRSRPDRRCRPFAREA